MGQARRSGPEHVVAPTEIRVVDRTGQTLGEKVALLRAEWRLCRREMLTEGITVDPDGSRAGYVEIRSRFLTVIRDVIVNFEGRRVAVKWPANLPPAKPST